MSIGIFSLPCHETIHCDIPLESPEAILTFNRKTSNFISNCMARQCLPLRQKFMECSMDNTALSLLMKHLVIGQRQKANNFSAFHWSQHVSPVSIGQHFVTTREVNFSEKDRNKLNYRFGPKRIKSSNRTRCAGHA